MSETLTMDHDAIDGDFSWLDVDNHTLAEAMMMGSAPLLFGELASNAYAGAAVRSNKVFEAL